VKLFSECLKLSNSFEDIRKECGHLNRFVNEIRYPLRFEVYDHDATMAIKAVEKIQKVQPIKEMIDFVQNRER